MENANLLCRSVSRHVWGNVIGKFGIDVCLVVLVRADFIRFVLRVFSLVWVLWSVDVFLVRGLILINHWLLVSWTLATLSAWVSKILAYAADFLAENLSDFLDVLGNRHLIWLTRLLLSLLVCVVSRRWLSFLIPCIYILLQLLWRLNILLGIRIVIHKIRLPKRRIDRHLMRRRRRKVLHCLQLTGAGKSAHMRTLRHSKILLALLLLL